MSSHSREASRDRELVLRHQPVPMWDSSDPERAPPPLPLNPGSPVTKANVSPGIQAVAANFTEKMRENSPSPYTTNPMPPKSPEKSLIKGQFHKRMQSLQTTDTRSEFLNYLENKSPERSLRASVLDQGSKQLEKSVIKCGSSPDQQDSEQDLSNLLIPNRYLSRPILGESTPPSATMLALQNMQLPSENEQRPRTSGSDTFADPKRSNSYSLESLSTQIHSLTDIASNLQREMAQLSRRSKDNATDLVSLKAATNARDEDIRKSLRDLSSNLATKFLEGDAATRWDISALLGSENGINSREPDSSPSSKRSHTAPRMQSPNPFISGMERDFCSSPAPISDGSASIALLEKVLREMATKDGLDKLVELVDELKSRPSPNDSGKTNDGMPIKMLEEILNLVKQDYGNKALVRSRGIPTNNFHSQGGVDMNATRPRSHEPEQAFAPDMEIIHGNQPKAVKSSVAQSDIRVTDEMLDIMRRVRSSVIEGGGMTNEVKALVRELRGEVLGMGRNLARKFEEVDSARSIEDTPKAPGKEEIAHIVDGSLHELRGQLASIVNENKRHSSALSEFRATMDAAGIYSIVKKALDNSKMSQSRELEGARMQKDDILEAVREAWETYKPEIELQNFGLERDEILECLSEGLKAYQPPHDQAVTYDQVLTAVQAGMQQFEQPPTITKEEITQTIRECLEIPQPRALDHEQLAIIRDEILQAVTESAASQSALTRDSFDSGIGRDEILSAVSDGLEAHFTTAKSMEHPHITKDDVAQVINDAFASQQSALSTSVQPTISRDEIIAAIAEGLESQNAIPREIELNKDDLMEAISGGLQEATSNANQAIGEEILERVREQLENMKEELGQHSSGGRQDTEHIIESIKDGVAAVRLEVEGYAAAASEASGKHEILDTVKEGFRLLQADLEKTITETSLAHPSQGNPDTPELLDAMEKEFEHLRQTLTSLLIRNNVSAEKDEILDAIRDISEGHRTTNNEDLSNTIKQEFESLRDSMNMSLVRAEPNSDKDEIIAALHESLEGFRDIYSQPKDASDASDALLSATGTLMDAFNEGVGTIRDDLGKLLERPAPAESDHSELLETLKEGLGSLKADVEMLRQSHQDAEQSLSRGGELILADEYTTNTDIEGLKALISQIQVKVDAIESAPRAAEFSEGALKKEDLDEVLLGLHELQGSVAGIVARESLADETVAKKEDTDAIETLLRNTKSQLDEMTFPAPDEIARAEQLSSLEGIAKETKEAVADLFARVEADCPTKSEIGTLEALMKDMWIALDELKGKGAQNENETERELEDDSHSNSEKLVKADLQTVEAMIFEVRTQVEELKLPDVETLPTKSDIQDLAALMAEFREKAEADNELTGQGFEARKIEHAGLAEKIEEAKTVVGELGEELKSKLDGSNEGLSELKQLLESLALSAESFTTVENVNELTELINREFERARGEQDATRLEKEERDAAALVKQDETRAAIIVEIGAKIDEKLGEVINKYDLVQASLESQSSEALGRDNEHLEAITATKALAEDIKFVIGSMGNSVNEACERMSVDAKTFFEKVDVSYTKMEEMQNEVKTQQEQARSDIERTAAATDRVESKLHEFHPQVLESIQDILSIVGKHYDHSQQTAQDLKMDLSILPSTIPSMLPALPPPEPEKYDDGPVQEKLNSLLEHTKSNQVQEALNVLIERVTSDQVHEKLDQLLSQTTSTNGQVYEKLNELLGHTTNTKGPIHDKLDTLIDHATNSDHSVTQMMKLDEMHKDIMETSRKMNEMLAAQTAAVAEENERRHREAEEAAVALERRKLQREQLEIEIVNLKEEKDSLLSMIQRLKTEKEDLAVQNAKLNKEVSGLEMALDLRHEEMQVMEERADSLEKRILEGVLDHARSVLLSRPNGINVKKVRSTRARGTSASSTASAPKEPRNILGSSVGLALKKRGQTTAQINSTAPSHTGKERRILSLSNVTGNRGVADRQSVGTGGFTNLKRSQSVKSSLSYRKASWGGRSSIANKENAFLEEEENQSGGESDTGAERRTSYTGTYADSMAYGPGSVVSLGQRVNTASTTHSIVTSAPKSFPDAVGNEEEQKNGEEDENEEGSDFEGETQLIRAGDPENYQPLGEEEEDLLDEEAAKMVLYRPHSDSGLGTEITSKVD